MALQFNTISEITSKIMQLNLKVHVIRLWITTTHKHKLTFTLNTIATELQDPSFHIDIFNIRTFEQLKIIPILMRQNFWVKIKCDSINYILNEQYY
ncbi:hypothetical protein R3W88_029579 [Solanum pinnatisectum]|uniref:Uncharacterized protein n=1 Tax=Solanum pinnatisectum TaxID=50273 RepID=A0AAV9K5Y6_9SOLN|nr:hypothetical protein R3W88_029579 [Solanum pinnatisectum]